MLKGEPVVILLVEDDPAHAEIARRNLEASSVPIRIVHVEDGQAALDYLQRTGEYEGVIDVPRPLVVLLDLRLPKVDGLEVLRRVKQDPVLKSIPVIVLTTSSAESDVSAAYHNHASSYLVKPVDFQRFTEQMQTFGYYWLTWNQFAQKPLPV